MSNQAGLVGRVLDVLSDNPGTRLITKLLDRLRLPSTILEDAHDFVFAGTGTSNLQKFLFLVGSVALLKKLVTGVAGLYRGVKQIPQHILLERQYKQQELSRRYGQNCWVLITGFTAGMGLCYAKKFAEMGFNLVLIGRNRQKIKSALRVISQYNDQILTKVIDADLTTDFDTLHSIVDEETKGIDVGIVINNAGASSHGQFTEISRKEHIRVYLMNVSLAVVICKIFVPRMAVREPRSAIVNVGSGMSVFTSPQIGIYPATKVMIDVFTRTIARENDKKIDVLLLTPMGVSTDMTGHFKGPFMITAEEAVRSTLVNIGRKTASFGAFRHKVSQALLSRMTQQQRFKMFNIGFARMAQAASK